MTSSVVGTSSISSPSDLLLESMRNISEGYLQRFTAILKRDRDQKAAIEAFLGGVHLSISYAKAFPSLRADIPDSEISRLPPPLLDGRFIFEHAPPSCFSNVDGFSKVRSDVSHSDAILEAMKGPTITDCAGVIDLAIADTLLKIWGAQRFNAVFRGVNLQLRQASGGNALRAFVKKGDSPTQKGAIVYFKNPSNYPERHPIGSFPGHYAVCDGAGKYFAIAVDPKGVTETQMKQFLADKFNKKDDPSLGTKAEKDAARLVAARSMAKRLYSVETATASNVCIDDQNLRVLNEELIGKVAAADPSSLSPEVVVAFMRASGNPDVILRGVYNLRIRQQAPSDAKKA